MTWPTRRTRRGTGIAALGLLALAAVWLPFLDLEPHVEPEFFFASDDPQLRASEAVARQFPAGEQLLVVVEAPALAALGDPARDEAAQARLDDAVERVGALSDDLAALDGVASVRGLTRGPAAPGAVAASPLWRRLLGDPSDPEAASRTQIVVSLGEQGVDGAVDPRALVAEVEDVVRRHRRPGVSIAVSGVPWVVEMIRRALGRDLRVFSLGALALFAIVLAAIVRVPRHVAGALLACLGACAASLVLLRLLGATIGLLTANLVAIVFVLTLSHVIFLLANFRAAVATSERARGEDRDDEGGSSDVESDDPAARAVRRTLPASAWAAVTTCLGFASLLTAAAAPLRELGFAGALGTAVAFLTAYTVMPLFLAPVATMPSSSTRSSSAQSVQSVSTRSGRLATPRPRLALVLSVLVALCAIGLPRVDTDPGLLDYFAADTPLRDGLEQVDAAGGSSPLLLVVERPDGGRFDAPSALEALAAAQQALDDDPSVGTALSLSVLLEEARRVPFAAFLSLDRLLTILEGPAFDRIASSFVTPDRRRALLFLRLVEAAPRSADGRPVPRGAVIDRLRTRVESHELRVVQVGGLYQLQAALGELVRSSVRRGLAGLLLLFALIAVAVSRSPRTALAMTLTLLGVPIAVLGAFGLLGVPLDLVSSPAATVALALGIDSMIHLVSARRRLAARGLDASNAWSGALERLGPPIVAAALILASGFGLFGLSAFPPTRRFGLAVAGGTAVAAALALVVLPVLGRWLEGGWLEGRRFQSSSRPPDQVAR